MVASDSPSPTLVASSLVPPRAVFHQNQIEIPSRNQFEQWRKQLYVWCKFAVLDTLQNKCDLVHLADDATTKGKSVASRKTQIHLTGKSLSQSPFCLASLSVFYLSPIFPICF